MLRRTFIKRVSQAPIWAGTGFVLGSCGADTAGTLLSTQEKTLPEELRIWSYYAPLVSYDGLFDSVENRHELDRLVLFDAVRRREPRITGRRADGTENRDRLNVEELRQAPDEYIRVDFWHDDSDSTGRRGHTLFLFKRYLDLLDAGETVFVGTGMIQGHFHVVMIEPTA